MFRRFLKVIEPVKVQLVSFFRYYFGFINRAIFSNIFFAVPCGGRQWGRGERQRVPKELRLQRGTADRGAKALHARHHVRERAGHLRWMWRYV